MVYSQYHFPLEYDFIPRTVQELSLVRWQSVVRTDNSGVPETVMRGSTPVAFQAIQVDWAPEAQAPALLVPSPVAMGVKAGAVVVRPRLATLY